MKKHELDSLIICKKCHTLHKRIKLHHRTKARCGVCGTVLYRHHKNLIETTLSLSIVSFLSLIVALLFPIMSINIAGVYQTLDMFSIFATLFQHKYYLVGLMLFFLILLFPLVIFISIITVLLFMRAKKEGYIVKRVLILIAKLLPWSMIDIFFISILVAMVKLFDYAQIELGVGFGAFFMILFLNLFVLKRINLGDVWNEYDMIYGGYNAKR